MSVSVSPESDPMRIFPSDATALKKKVATLDAFFLTQRHRDTE
jgi:5,10-methylenetetrahydrofolate reductase